MLPPNMLLPDKPLLKKCLEICSCSWSQIFTNMKKKNPFIALELLGSRIPVKGNSYTIHNDVLVINRFPYVIKIKSQSPDWRKRCMSKKTNNHK